MGKKFSFDSFFKLFIFLYLIVLINNISYASELGIINNNKLVDIFLYFRPSEYMDTYTSMFMISTIMFTYIMIHSQINDIHIFDDDVRKRKVKIKLIPYKIFVLITVLFSAYTMYFAEYKNLMLSSFVLILFSIYMHYLKSCYIKSYIYDRKLEWVSNCKYGNENEGKVILDTKSWRYKIWFNGFERVKLKSIIGIISSNFIIYVMISIIVLNQNSEAKMIIALIISVIIVGRTIIDSVFGLFTSIEGKCSGILEERSKNDTIRYKICVTDYENKREVMINIHESYGIEEMDNVRVVHGVLSKRVVSVNNITINRNHIVSTVISIFLIVVVVIPSARINIENIKYKKEAEEYEKLQYQNAIYEGKVPPQNRPTTEESSYKKIINIDKVNTQTYEDGDVIVEVDKLYLNKNSSKLNVKIKNNTKRGLVLNSLDVIKIYDENDKENSNILLPGESYSCEVNIDDTWDKNKKHLNVDLDYTLSESIIFDNQYMDYNGYLHYDLNVIDNNCSIDIDLQNESTNIYYEVYDTFYSVSDIVAKFK